MTVSFQTNKLKSRRKAIIDGHEYTVRQLGNIEQLEMTRLQDELSSLVSKYPDDAKESDFTAADNKEIHRLTTEMNELVIALFDDGTEGNSKARALIKTLSEEDVFDMLTQIFMQTEEK